MTAMMHGWFRAWGGGTYFQFIVVHNSSYVRGEGVPSIPCGGEETPAQLPPPPPDTHTPTLPSLSSPIPPPPPPPPSLPLPPFPPPSPPGHPAPPKGEEGGGGEVRGW
jgi:hypothetical protein